MVKPLSETPGFTQISPSIIQQDADPAMALEEQSKAKVGTPDPQAQPTAKTEADLKPSSVPLEQPEVEPVETSSGIDAPVLQPDSTPPEVPEIVGMDSVLKALESDAEPDFQEVDEAYADWNIRGTLDADTENPQAPFPELEGYKSVMGDIMQPDEATAMATGTNSSVSVDPSAKISGLKKSELPAVTNYIREAAKARGIDPEIAVKVARSEGLAAGIWQSRVRKGGYREPSYGPFQLLKGGKGTGFPLGMGNDFQKKTGLDPADPKNIKKTIDFALDHAKKYGWSAWYGAKKVGVGRFTGISRG